MTKNQSPKDDSKASDLYKKLHDWEKKHPHPDPFDDPKYNADFKYYLQLPYWTVREAVILSFGKDPREVGGKSSFGLSQSELRRNSFRKEYVARYEIVQRSIDTRVLFSEDRDHRFRNLRPVSSHDFSQWAARQGWVLPKKLQSWAEKKIRPKENDPLEHSKTWLEFTVKVNRAIDEFPEWRKSIRILNKSGNFKEWLVKDIGADQAEARLIKKFLSDIYPELRRTKQLRT